MVLGLSSCTRPPKADYKSALPGISQGGGAGIVELYSIEGEHDVKFFAKVGEFRLNTDRATLMSWMKGATGNV
ncbi:hypothetical protein PROH_02295 [Prochlorothrix hollandica PCC 9006 = CALU 1027]|uniref:Uncharacterized protein n=1 Tax=Prochlorothrix hollandica PCC 9006 = CALU 1027 TaxID=317619 RepID=A0A0M2Q2M9_PROHO|nr:hypothetical protein PROH_02295 [Prochlorothrix hollandica PCC 9006 = CALU 1027]